MLYGGPNKLIGWTLILWQDIYWRWRICWMCVPRNRILVNRTGWRHRCVVPRVCVCRFSLGCFLLARFNPNGNVVLVGIVCMRAVNPMEWGESAQVRVRLWLSMCAFDGPGDTECARARLLTDEWWCLARWRWLRWESTLERRKKRKENVDANPATQGNFEDGLVGWCTHTHTHTTNDQDLSTWQNLSRRAPTSTRSTMMMMMMKAMCSGRSNYRWVGFRLNGDFGGVGRVAASFSVGQLTLVPLFRCCRRGC